MERTAPTLARYHALDALRGAMMLLGIYLHAAVAYDVSGNWPWKQAELTRALEPTMALIHIFRMPIFYVMCGFFGALLVDRRGWRRAAENRFQRIALPFLLGWLVLFPMVALLVGSARYGLAETLDLFISGRILGFAHPLHLWFLEYLLLLYGLAVLVVPAVARLPLRWRETGRQLFRGLLASWLAPLVLAVPSWCVLLAMPRAELLDPPGFLPQARILLVYAIPFCFGWLLYGNADLLAVLRRRGWVFLALAMIPCSIFIHLLPFPIEQPARFYAMRAVHAVAMWLLILGLTGVFLRHLAGYSAWRRYLCDASYFLYLAHMPVLLALQMLVAPLPWSPLVKCAVVLSLAVGFLLVIYDGVVRNGAIGALLNGRRLPRGASLATA